LFPGEVDMGKKGKLKSRRVSRKIKSILVLLL
jgi:hypothetical protein